MESWCGGGVYGTRIRIEMVRVIGIEHRCPRSFKVHGVALETGERKRAGVATGMEEKVEALNMMASILETMGLMGITEGCFS